MTDVEYEARRGGVTPEEICRAKYACRNRKRAKRYASAQRKEHGTPFRVYRCPVCRLWHLRTVKTAAVVE